METTPVSEASFLFSGELVHLIWNTGLVVKIVLLILLVLSVFTWAVIFFKWREMRRVTVASRRFSEAFAAGGGGDRLNRVAKELIASPLAEVYRTGYAEMQRFGDGKGGGSSKEFGSENMKAVERSMERAGSTAMNRLERYLVFLATTGSAAPFIGLFGTVWGIMESFQSIGAAGAASLAVVAPGVSEALIATAMGLFAAIPAVMGYNFLLRRVQIIDRELDQFISSFIDQVSNR